MSEVTWHPTSERKMPTDRDVLVQLCGYETYDVKRYSGKEGNWSMLEDSFYPGGCPVCNTVRWCEIPL